MAANPEVVSPDPVLYESRYESTGPAQSDTALELIETLHSVRATSHAILRGQMRIASDLPPNLAQGLFAHGATYPLVMCFSTNSGATSRGLAVKVIGVAGDRIRGSDGDLTQDFVMVDRTRALDGGPRRHILGETFFSMTPFLYGKYMAKFSIAPASTELRALQKAPLPLAGKPNGLRESAIAFFQEHGADWELRVQLCVDIDQMPIENPKIAWAESLCAWLPIARIVVPPQLAWSEARAKALADRFSFSPWHGLAAHRPLGSINRLLRKPSAIDEPRDLAQFPD